MAKKQAKQDLPNYFEANTWLAHDARNTMNEAMAMIGIIARSSDHSVQKALFGVLTVLVNAEMTLNEYLDKPDGLE